METKSSIGQVKMINYNNTMKKFLTKIPVYVNDEYLRDITIHWSLNLLFKSHGVAHLSPHVDSVEGLEDIACGHIGYFIEGHSGANISVSLYPYQAYFVEDGGLEIVFRSGEI